MQVLVSVEVITLCGGDWRDSLNYHLVQTFNVEHLRAEVFKTAQLEESRDLHLLVFSFNFLPRSDSFFSAKAGVKVLMVVFSE